MLRWQLKILRISYMVLDFLSLAISIPIAAGLANRLSIQRELFQSPLEILGFISICYLCFISVFMLVELYDSYMSRTKPITLKLGLKTFFAFVAGHFFSYLFLTLFLPAYTHIFHLLFTGLFFLISIVIKIIYYSLRNYAYHNSSKKRNVLVVGQSSNGLHYVETIRRYAYLHYSIIGFIHIKHPPKSYSSSLNEASVTEARLGVNFGDGLDPDGKDELFESGDRREPVYEAIPHLGGLENLRWIVTNHIVDELVVTRPLSYDKKLGAVLEDMQLRGITVTMLLNRINHNETDAIVTMIEDIPALKFHTVSLDEGQLVAKRALDIVGALAGMVIFGLTWLIFAPLIKLESKGPVIFKQDRVGKNGRVFRMWKFRSMCDDAESKKQALEARNEIRGHMFKITDDPRMTRVGKIIRKTNIDEIPQFYNVLIGDMSLVGTRPPTVDEVKEYQAHHYKRISVIPGITGFWQVSGGSKIKDFEEVVQLDNQYIEGWSVWKDIKIIAKTVLVVLNTIKPSLSKKMQEKAVYENPDGKEASVSQGQFSTLWVSVDSKVSSHTAARSEKKSEDIFYHSPQQRNKRRM